METDRQKFERLRDKWLEETGLLSCAGWSNKYYLQIIGMGERAIPFIIEDWETTDNHWFVALSSITGENPVKEESKGYIGEMKQQWLEFLVVRSCK